MPSVLHLSFHLLQFYTKFTERKHIGGLGEVMVKLASAREIRLYGPWLIRHRLEYINAGVYVFAVILLLVGFVAQLSRAGTVPGLILVLIALVLLIVVNIHDLFAHLTGIDYQIPFVASDMQLGLVEFAVPMILVMGSLLSFMGLLFLLIQEDKAHPNFRLEKNALNMLIAGPVLWLIGSIFNSCQIYERADGRTQILQVSVQIPLLLGSLLFMVGAIINAREEIGPYRHGVRLLGRSWVWMGIFWSLLFFVGGVINVMKVFLMQTDGMRLEKLRGGAQEILNRRREGLGQLPLVAEEHRRRTRAPGE